MGIAAVGGNVLLSAPPRSQAVTPDAAAFVKL